MNPVALGKVMSNETVFLKEMRKYFVCFIIFGLWTSWKNCKFENVLRLYSVLLIKLIFCSFFCAIIFRQFFGNITLSSTIATSLFFTMLSSHFAISIESLYKRKLQEELIAKISLVDQLFRMKMGKCVAYNSDRQELFLRNIIVVLVILFLKVSVAIYSHYQIHLVNFMYPAMYSSWILRLRSLQVIFFVYLTRSRLILIQNELKDIRNTATSHHILEAASVISPENSTEISKFETLLSLKEIYETLHDTCELINKTFGWSLLAISLQSFIDFTCNCYWIFFLFGEKQTSIGPTSVCISFLIQNIASFSMLAFYCSSCSQHVRLLFKF